MAKVVEDVPPDGLPSGRSVDLGEKVGVGCRKRSEPLGMVVSNGRKEARVKVGDDEGFDEGSGNDGEG